MSVIQQKQYDYDDKKAIPDRCLCYRMSSCVVQVYKLGLNEGEM